MKYLPHSFFIALLLLISFSCKKISFISSPDASLGLSADTVYFDTVFTAAGSVTQSLKIFNQNNQKLKLSQVRLMGGSSSAYKINVDGTAGVNFTNIEIEPNDSVYVFVSVTINPNAADLPFIVRDSILVNYNGNERYIRLESYGQNAHFLSNRRITKDSTWNNDLPFVILGNLLVDSNVTLTINKGCQIYCHANAPFVVNGSLKINGERYDSTRVIFSGDRIDAGYKDLPAAWPGIYFTESSTSNILSYTTIKNAYQGIITASATSLSPKITLQQCIIENIYDAGIISLASSIKAVNCLISNCGSNILVAGGDYSFTHCTVVSYSNAFVDHKYPVLSITNAYTQNQIFALKARFQNCIFYGEGGTAENEIMIDKKTSADLFEVTFENVLYKNKDNAADNYFTNSIKNENPDFDSVDAGRRLFNFHLKSTSPCIDKGIVTGVAIDLDGKARETSTLPDLGCYEQ